jgi:hypothetical protein
MYEFYLFFFIFNSLFKLRSLEEQIRMRFNMLNKNNVPAKAKKKKIESDSYSDKSQESD